MGDERYSEYRDDRTRVICGERAIQQRHLDSVTGRIGHAIEVFFRTFDGQEFNSGTLHAWVDRKAGPIAPGSADRVMRNLRKQGVIEYTLVDRGRSLYRAGHGIRG